MHWIVAVFNMCDYSRFVTDMTGTTFGLYVGVVYISKGVELLVDEFDAGNAAGGWLSVVIAVLFALCVYHVERIGGKAFGRKFLAEWWQISPQDLAADAPSSDAQRSGSARR